MPPRILPAALLLAVLIQPAAATTVRLIDTPADSLATALTAIDSAQSEISVATYIIDTGDVAKTLLRHLGNAAARGVRVRLLHDAFEPPLPKPWVRHLCSLGVEIHNYNPPCLLRPVQLNWRLHAKILVIDRQAAILGSRNWQDSHYLIDPEASFIDQDILIRGDTAERIAKHFDWLWQCPKSTTVDMEPKRRFDIWNLGTRDESQTSPLSSLLTAVDATPPNRSILRSCRRCGLAIEPIPAPIITPTRLCLLTDRCCKKTDRNMARSIRRLIRSANRSVTIESPYPALSLAMADAMIDAANRNVRVTLITNSYRTIDQKDTYAAFLKRKRKLQSAGIRIIEIGGDQILHAKTMIIDDHTAMVGSYNFDARSERFNLEIAVIIHDESFVQQLRQRIAARSSLQTHCPLTKSESCELLRRRIRIQICHRCL